MDRHGERNSRDFCFALGVLFGAGDLSSQCVIEKRGRREIDWLRTLRFGLIGCAVGPSLTKWYGLLDKLNTGNTVLVAVKKVLADQLIASPIVCGTVMFMSGLMNGDEWPQICKRLNDNYSTVMLNSYMVRPAVVRPFVPRDSSQGRRTRAIVSFTPSINRPSRFSPQFWPAVQLLNFTVIPAPYRVLTVQTLSVGWNTYLSFVTVGRAANKE